MFSAVQAEEPVRFIGDWSFWKRGRRLVEFPRPLLELEGDVHFYEPPKTPFPDPVFGKFDAQVTGLGIEILGKNVDWLRQNPHDYWIRGSIFIPVMIGDGMRSIYNF